MEICGAVQWGDVPTWATAVAAIVALIFAAKAASVTKQLYKVEFERDNRANDERRERDLDRERDQAGRVSAWFGWRDYAHATLGGDPNEYGALLRNASELPVYGAQIAFVAKKEWEATPPPQRLPISVEVRDVIAPGEESVFVPIDRALLEAEFPDRAERERVSVTITFTDASGRRWHRGANGQLHRPAPEAMGLAADAERRPAP